MAATGSGIRFEVVERRCWHRSVMAGCCCWDEDIMVDMWTAFFGVCMIYFGTRSFGNGRTPYCVYFMVPTIPR